MQKNQKKSPKNFVFRNNYYLCSPKADNKRPQSTFDKSSGCSSARLEYTSGGRGVASSNLVTPTKFRPKACKKLQAFVFAPQARLFTNEAVGAKTKDAAIAAWDKLCATHKGANGKGVSEAYNVCRAANLVTPTKQSKSLQSKDWRLLLCLEPTTYDHRAESHLAWLIAR